MHYPDRVKWIAGASSEAWDIHYQALQDAIADPEVIVLSVGDPDFATPAPIIEVAQEALRNGDTHYTPILGIEPLRQAISETYRSIGAKHLNSESIAVLAGAQNALFSASLCTLSPNDEVITLDPAYVTYEAAIGVSGAKLVRVSGNPKNGFRPNLEAIDNAITPATRAIAFSTPNNPSGMALNRQEMQALVELAHKHDLWLWSDEVYAQIMFENEHVSLSQFDQAQERSIVIGSLSKSYAMTGWRVGWIAGPQSLIRHIENLSLCMLYGLPGFIQQAAVHALQQESIHVKSMRDTYLKRRDLAVSLLKDEPTLELIVPQAGMFILIDVRKTGLSSNQFVRDLYVQQKVSVLDGAAFSPQLDGYIRLSFTNGEQQLAKACARLKQFLKGCD